MLSVTVSEDDGAQGNVLSALMGKQGSLSHYSIVALITLAHVVFSLIPRWAEYVCVAVAFLPF